MINWDVNQSNERKDQWFFPNFEIQEYLLPMLHIGGQHFDEYGDTKYDREDCMRLRKAIEFVIERVSFTNKPEIRYESVKGNLVTLDKSLIITALEKLDEAAETAIIKGQSLVFYGD